jgi:hypothetical protein
LILGNTQVLCPSHHQPKTEKDTYPTTDCAGQASPERRPIRELDLNGARFVLALNDKHHSAPAFAEVPENFNRAPLAALWAIESRAVRGFMPLTKRDI